MPGSYQLTTPYTLTCPECGGALFPPLRDPTLRYRCHIGHALSWQSLMEAQLERIEAALGTVLVGIKERAELCHHLAQSDEVEPETLQAMVAQAEQRAAAIKGLLEADWMPVP